MHLDYVRERKWMHFRGFVFFAKLLPFTSRKSEPDRGWRSFVVEKSRYLSKRNRTEQERRREHTLFRLKRVLNAEAKAREKPVETGWGGERGGDFGK